MTAEIMNPGTAARAEALTGRLFNASQETLDVLTTYIGERLGLYQALRTHGAATPVDLATRADCDPRYVREWLEQQAVTGILEVEDADAPAEERRYRLPDGHGVSLTDPDSLFAISALPRGLVACAQALPQLLDAFRTGGGVAWADYGPDVYEAQGDFNRPWLRARFGAEHLPRIPDAHQRLLADPPARVADLGCGAGWAGIALAQAYPKISVQGFDLDDASVALARKHAADAGVADRVSFEVADVTDGSLAGSFDLVLTIEMIHDLARPVQALTTMRRLLRPGGVALAVEEKTGDRFTPGDPVERFLYGFSVLLCLPVSLTEQPSAATGTVMRAETFRRYALDAGFTDLEALDIDLPMHRYYRLVP